jgi:glycine hydroxymethyltransferase
VKIALGADHGGYDLKETLLKMLNERGLNAEDLGCHDKTSVDYPDYAEAVADKVSSGAADEGILVCTSGIGMTIAANRFPGVRAALCMNADMATMARSHNDANVLVLAGASTGEADAQNILQAWLDNAFSGEARHARRVEKINHRIRAVTDTSDIGKIDPELELAMRGEADRQQDTLCLIASENHASRAVREAQGSVLTNKYAEGYPGKRWYQGCAFVDIVEQLAIDRARELFGAEHVNVQPNSGSSANISAYLTVLEPGDTILAMSLAHGGHLTHGHEVNVSGTLYRIVSYGVEPDTELLDMDNIAALAAEHRPKLIVAGASAYSRTFDFERFREIADSVGALLLVDMAHIAGLIAGGVHPSPVPYADIVTTTTHKTLRGPRAGMILCRESLGADIDRKIFPGTQGGPFMHAIAGKAVCLQEALQPEFKTYAEQIVKNAIVMAEALTRGGCRIVSGGTENHLMLVDLTDMNLTGKAAATALEKAGIVVNKNAIPFDKKSPFVTSGIRIGTPSITTRGMKESETETVAETILAVLRNLDDQDTISKTRAQVCELISQFPVP